jgi:S-adenosylmethionine:tRNA ribosyltransferase-isomerase
MMKPMIDLIDINDYHYELPESRIAKYPLPERDRSKLIFYKDKKIGIGSFLDLPQHIPGHSVMVFNETRVIQARLLFHKESGARIEIFCLEPADHNGVSELAFQQESPVTWKCLVGNARKWKEGRLAMDVVVDDKNTRLYARMTGPVENAFLIEFSWDEPSLGFSEILDAAGKVPLPPYIKRASEDDDKLRYQTIYARHDGSVAAPTAGLHFTDRVLERLLEKNISLHKLTLHVGAGTFKPVSAASIREHTMHDEQVIISRSFIENITSRLDETIVAVGTTSVRSFESLYWLGLKLIKQGIEPDQFHVGQWEPYEAGLPDINPKDALSAILDYMRENHLENISGRTRLIIIPGYGFRFVDALVTNFHMPKSTLLLLVAALVGERWREIYQTALENGFRFLSYGDSCLFFRDDQKRVFK